MQTRVANGGCERGVQCSLQAEARKTHLAETEQVRQNESVPTKQAIRHAHEIESFGKPVAKLTDTEWSSTRSRHYQESISAMTFPLILIIVALVWMALALWSIHNSLVPLRGRIEKTERRLLSKQFNALNLVNTYATLIATFHSNESPILTNYLKNMERATLSGMDGKGLVNIFQSFAPPSTQSSSLYSTTMIETTRLGSEFDTIVDEYLEAVTAMDNCKRRFPARLFADKFFEIPDGHCLPPERCQLFPPNLVAAHLKQVRETYLTDTKKASS